MMKSGDGLYDVSENVFFYYIKAYFTNIKQILIFN